MKVLEIEQFKFFSEERIEGKLYDFHNEFNCQAIILNNGSLEISLEHFNTKQIVIVGFTEVSIEKLNFSEASESDWTIDSLYRGKFDRRGELIEELDGRGYIYLSFVEGQSLEFWAEDVKITGRSAQYSSGNTK